MTYQELIQFMRIFAVEENDMLMVSLLIGNMKNNRRGSVYVIAQPGRLAPHQQVKEAIEDHGWTGKSHSEVWEKTGSRVEVYSRRWMLDEHGSADFASEPKFGTIEISAALHRLAFFYRARKGK